MTIDGDHGRDYRIPIAAPTGAEDMQARVINSDIILGKLQLTLDGAVLDAYTEQKRRVGDNRRIATVTFFEPNTQIEVGNLYSVQHGTPGQVRGRILMRDASNLPIPVGEYSTQRGGYDIIPVIGAEKLLDQVAHTHPIDYFFKRYSEALSTGASIVNANYLKKHGRPLEHR